MFTDISQSHSQGQAPSQSNNNQVTITINGEPQQVPAGYNVTAALLVNGHNSNRSSAISGQSRGAYCLMGVCFECVCQIDGIANRQGCMTTVQQGMAVNFQQGCGDIHSITPLAPLPDKEL